MCLQCFSLWETPGGQLLHTKKDNFPMSSFTITRTDLTRYKSNPEQTV